MELIIDVSVLQFSRIGPRPTHFPVIQGVAVVTIRPAVRAVSSSRKSLLHWGLQFIRAIRFAIVGSCLTPYTLGVRSLDPAAFHQNLQP